MFPRDISETALGSSVSRAVQRAGVQRRETGCCFMFGHRAVNTVSVVFANFAASFSLLLAHLTSQLAGGCIIIPTLYS